MKKLISLMVIIAFFAACNPTGKISNQDISFIYDQGVSFIHPEFIVYHSADSSSTVFVKINSTELLYVKPVNKNKYNANFSIAYTLLSSYDSKELLDSSIINYTDTSYYSHRGNIIIHFDVKVHYQKNYILKVVISDLNRKHDCISYVAINKNDKNERQNFLVLNTDSTVFFKNYISKDQQIKVQYNDKSKKIIFVKHYSHLPYMAAPPYSANLDKQPTFMHDSIFSLPLLNGQTPFFKLPRTGIYQFLTDTSQANGLTVCRFYNDFPAITTPEQMLSCLRYLTSRTEFEKMNLVKDKKQSVDDFWLENGGNPNRAKELVKRFYTRVEEANRYFTSYVEGWKTDRGMIYIVYGLPNVVYRSEYSEVWIYGEPNHILSIYYTFSFENKSPFSDNSFILSRSTAYKENWFRTLSSWRK